MKFKNLGDILKTTLGDSSKGSKRIDFSENILIVNLSMKHNRKQNRE